MRWWVMNYEKPINQVRNPLSMPGIVKGDKVLVEDEAEGSKLYNRGYFGKPLSGGGIELDLLEAIYLYEAGRLDVAHDGSQMDHEKLLKLGIRHVDDFEIKYLVFREMRLRGYVVKDELDIPDFLVYPRGGGPKVTPYQYWLMAISEQTPFSIGEVSALMQRIESIRKKLIMGLVDEEGDITYYECKRMEPKGKIISEKAENPIRAVLLNDRVIIESDEGRFLQQSEFFGKIIWETLQLSLIEAYFLAERGDIFIENGKTGRKIKPATLLKKAKQAQSDFTLRYNVYKDLKARGVLVKTGFKYGSHFRAYQGEPDSHHARFLVHGIAEDFSTSWQELSRIVRLAHGVKKEIVLARVLNDDVEYFRFMRIRP